MSKWRILGVLCALAAAGVAVFLLFLRHESRSSMELPVPTGQYGVGRRIESWTTGNATGELLVWIWYPAASSHSGKPAPYFPAYWKTPPSTLPLPVAFINSLVTRDAAVIETHSVPDLPVSPVHSSYPVVIIRAGSGAQIANYTTLAEDLASHGYIVVGFDAPYRTGAVVFPDGRVFVRSPELNPENFDSKGASALAERLVSMWVDDTRFVVNHLTAINAADPSGNFTGRLDLEHLGIFGHSLGGATALQFCHDDTRCKAAINIDGNPFGSVVREGTTSPALLLFENVDLSKPPRDPEIVEMFAKMRSLLAHLKQGRMLTVQGANHFSFADVILVKSHFIVRIILLLTRGIDAGRGLAVTTAVVHTFFDVHLKNAPQAAMDDLKAAYPELRAAQPF